LMFEAFLRNGVDHVPMAAHRTEAVAAT
jgi:hypothetical protein